MKEEKIEDMEGQSTSEDDALIRIIMQQDLERIKFVLRSYIRVRLAKIETYAKLLTTDPEWRYRLSQEELNYASKYFFLKSIFC